MRLPLFSLRVRLLLPILVAVVPVGGLMLHSGVERRQYEAAAVQADALRLARLAATQQRELVEGTRQLLAGLAQLPAVLDGDAAACSTTFASLLRQRPLYANLGAARPSGDVFCSALPLASPVSFADLAFFQRALQTGDFVVGEYQVAPIAGRTVLFLAHPALSAAGEVRAVVFAPLDLGWLNRFAAEVELPPGSTLTVVDRAGIILVHHPDPERWVGQSIQATPLFRAMVTEDEGVAEAPGMDGVPRLYGFHWLRGVQPNGLLLVRIGIPTEVAFAEANQTLARNQAVLGLVVALVLAAAWLGADRSVRRPAAVLLGATRRLRAGDLGARFGLAYGRGELGELARAFDEMAAALAEREAQRRRAEETLRQSEERYRLLFEAVPVGIGISDFAGNILAANPAIQEMTGSTLEELKATKLGDMYAEPGERERLLPALRSSGGVCDWEVRLKRRDGTIYIALLSAVLMELGGQIQVLASVRDITERKQAEEQVRRQAARAQALVRTARRLNALLDLQAVLNAVCEEATRAVGFPAGGVTLDDDGRGMLRVAGVCGLPSASPERLQPVPRAIYDGSPRRVGSVIVTPDVQAIGPLPDSGTYAALSIRTAVSVDIAHEGRLIGALHVVSLGEVRQVTDDDLELLRGLADQTALAITNARLYGTSERQLRRVQALRDIDVAIASSFDLSLTLRVVVEQAFAQLHVDACVVLLLDPHSQVLEHATGRGFRSREIERSRLRLGEGHAGRAVLERRIIRIPSLAEESDAFDRARLPAVEGFVSYHAAPLIAKGQVRGVLEVFHRAPFEPDEEWLSFLQVVAGQAAIAVDNATLFGDLQRSNAELHLAYDTTLEGWSRALDLRDKETEGHSQRVTDLTLRTCRAMGMEGAELVHVRRGALLHDIGKMGIPDTVLLKPEPLTDQEWVVMRRHPTYAYELLSPIAYLRPALDIPYCHHERWDGAGYPRGLRGETIPLAARVFALADVWDALSSDRPYRPAWSVERVREEIRAGSGTHFDPELVGLFLRIASG